MKPHYHAIQEPNFRTREPFIRAVADLIKSTVDEVGGAVSVRQIYYQAVNAGLVESGDKGYRGIQSAVKDGRLVGWVAWNVIEDRGRKPLKPYYESSVSSALESLAHHYKRDRCAGQRFRIEVWLEQAALRDVVWPVCDLLGVPLIVCGGFTSHDSLYQASERQRGYKMLEQHGLILHLSDLDPSGVVMADTIREVVGALAEQTIVVQRVGLVAAQAETYGLLPRPLKDGDTRAPAYREVHGDFAYELDGLPAAALQSIVKDAITPLIDWSIRGEVLAQEEQDRATIRELIELARGEDLI